MAESSLQATTDPQPMPRRPLDEATGRARSRTPGGGGASGNDFASLRAEFQAFEDKVIRQVQYMESQTSRLLQIVVEPLESKMSAIEGKYPMLDWKISEVSACAQSLREDFDRWAKRGDEDEDYTSNWKHAVQDDLQQKQDESLRELHIQLVDLVTEEVSARVQEQLIRINQQSPELHSLTPASSLGQSMKLEVARSALQSQQPAAEGMRRDLEQAHASLQQSLQETSDLLRKNLEESAESIREQLENTASEGLAAFVDKTARSSYTELSAEVVEEVQRVGEELVSLKSEMESITGWGSGRPRRASGAEAGAAGAGAGPSPSSALGAEFACLEDPEAIAERQKQAEAEEVARVEEIARKVCAEELAKATSSPETTTDEAGKATSDLETSENDSITKEKLDTLGARVEALEGKVEAVVEESTSNRKVMDDLVGEVASRSALEEAIEPLKEEVERLKASSVAVNKSDEADGGAICRVGTLSKEEIEGLVAVKLKEELSSRSATKAPEKVATDVHTIEEEPTESADRAEGDAAEEDAAASDVAAIKTEDPGPAEVATAKADVAVTAAPETPAAEDEAKTSMKASVAEVMKELPPEVLKELGFLRKAFEELKESVFREKPSNDADLDCVTPVKREGEGDQKAAKMALVSKQDESEAADEKPTRIDIRQNSDGPASTTGTEREEQVHDGAVGTSVKAGMEVVVTQPMKTDSDDAIGLRVGLGGFVSFVDPDGDALVFFDGVERVQWVFKASLSKLCIFERELASAQEVQRRMGRPVDSMSVAEVKAVVESAGLITSDCFSLSTLLERAREAKAKLERAKLRERTVPLPTGLRLQYSSPSQKRWVDCKVIAVDEDGSVRIDIKPGHWFSLEEQATKFRPRPLSMGSTASYKPLDAADAAPWTETSVAEVREDGAVRVWAEPERWLSQVDQLDCLCQTDSLPVLRGGDTVVVVRNFDSDSDDPVRLCVGQRGTVAEVDEDGDALIDFEAHPVAQWVIGSNFEKLCVVSALAMPSSPSSPTVTASVAKPEGLEGAKDPKSSSSSSAYTNAAAAAAAAEAGTGGSDSKVLASKRRGSIILVQEEFMSDSLEGVPLKFNSVGIVAEVDEDGDMLVEFADGDSQWVAQPNQNKLKILSDSTPTSPTPATPTSAPQKNMQIMVTSEFMSDSLDPSPLRRESVGRVQEVDEEGDLLVDFGTGQAQWIFANNLDKIQVVGDSSSPGGGSSTKPSPAGAGVGSTLERIKELDERDSEDGSRDVPASLEGQRLIPGCMVVAKEDFLSDNWESDRVKVLSQGRVVEIDAEGDALVDFGASGGAQWVGKANHSKLVVLKNLKTGEVSPTTGPSRGKNQGATAAEMQSGRKVTIRRGFFSDSTERVELKVGVEGRIRRIDNDGDALIQFEGIRRRQWVFCTNFQNLTVDTSEEDGQLSVQGAEAHGSSASELVAGGEALYKSTSHDRWIPCVVEKTRQDGAVQLDVKPGVWITKKMQEQRLRRRNEPLYKVDEALSYKSPTFGKWVDVEVVKVRKTDGAIQIDAKEGCWFSVQDQMSKLRPRTAIEGVVVEVLREMPSDSENNEVLPVGRRGIVQEIDSEGDALIQFNDSKTLDWVCKAKMANLLVISQPEQGKKDGKVTFEDTGAGVKVDPNDASAEAIRVGVTVSVLKDFMSDSEQQVSLKWGQRGVVKEIDDEGDMLIEFVGLSKRQWIFKNNHKALGVVQVRSEDAKTLKQLLEER